ncbi:septum formation protein Maf [Candidatus Peribacteria bacterium]|nr:septum formation protein Maf [Candidatus Peribacteria bacterium]
MKPLVLASASPQRRQLLEALGVPSIIDPSSFSEEECTESDPVARAVSLACSKAGQVRVRHPDAFVLGCDTLVVAHNGMMLEKPRDASQALSMLRQQRGCVSTVHSALCLLAPGDGAFHGVSTSAVHFAPLSDAQCDWWIRTGLWRDRSGGFQIDGRGQFLIERLEGDWSSVVGLPVYLLGQLLSQAGIPLETLPC